MAARPVTRPDLDCVHLYARRPGWWRHRARWDRYQCTSCGYRTRAYDSLDFAAGRPFHRHMSVACSINTVPRPTAPGWGR